MIAFDLATHFLISAFHDERMPSLTNPIYTDYKKPGPRTHYTTEGGGSYSMRPDLTRPGFGTAIFSIAMSPAGLATMATVSAMASVYAETKNIQGLVRTESVDSSTKIFMLQGLTNY